MTLIRFTKMEENAQCLENDEVLKLIVKTLELVIQLRDPYTVEHQKRVAELAKAIGEDLKLSTESLCLLKFASRIHDIGKVVVPIEILNKPGKISQLEYELVKEHATVGFQLLNNLGFKDRLSQIVFQHHERNDGSGYPGGLKDSEILFEAKVLAVADVVEAILSHRPYRPALGIDFALNEIISHRGVKYEESVVDSCVKILKQRPRFFEEGQSNSI